MNRVFVAVLLLFCLCFCCGAVFAQEREEGAAEEAYIFPVIRPEAFIFGGYRFVGHSGDEKADQYEYLHDSIPLGAELRMFSFPHRLHLDLDFKNEKDFFGDASYAYKDIVLFRGINRTLFHNLENITLIDLNPATTMPGVDVRDKDEHYGLKFSDSTAFLRFKTPEFPFHVYFDGTFITKSGSEQQRSLLGSGSAGDLVRASQKRDVDLASNNFVFGANTHLGPVEMDISHGERRSDVDGTRVFFDVFAPATSGSSVIRAGGLYPHNLIPEFKSSSNTVKLHSSYTGALVASATFSNLNKENLNSGAKADYFIGAGEVTWMPMPGLAVFVKYRHRETDIDNPGRATITDASNPLNTYTYAVKPSISSTIDTASGTVRYRPLNGLMLVADYIYEKIGRTNAGDWYLPDSTTRNVYSLSANLKVVRNLSLKARYTHKDVDNPAYNSEPEHSDEGRVSLSWIPTPCVNTLVSYIITEERRSNLRFVDPYYNPIPGANNRDVRKDRLLGSVTLLMAKDVSLTTSYSYFHNDTRQDLVFRSDTAASLLDPSVPNKITAHNLSADISYMPQNDLTFNAGFGYTLSKANFYPANSELLLPVSIASFSDLKIKEYVFSLSGDYKFRNGFAVGVKYRYSKLDDVLDNPWDDVSDGHVHIVFMTISKKW